jgi:hypothetical protein
MNPEFIPQLDQKITELNSRPELQLNRAFSVVRRLEEHLQGIALRPGQLEHLIDELFFYVVMLPVPIPLDEKAVFTRAVRYEEARGIGYEQVSRLSYIHPKSGVAQPVGRMNKKDRPVFYASKGEGANALGAVLSEMAARPGEVYNVLFSETAPFEPPEPPPELSPNVLRVMPVGVFDYYRRGLNDPFGLHQDYRDCYEYFREKTHPAGMLAMQLVDAFLTDILKRKGTELLYSVTSLIPAEIESDTRIDGVLYPSVEFEGFPNVALKTAAAELKLKHVRAISLRVIERYGYGIFATETIGVGAVVGGRIAWGKLALD